MAPPRKHSTVKEAKAAKRKSNAAWSQKASASDWVRVSVLVPEGREPEIKEMARALRASGKVRKAKVQKIMGQRVVDKRKPTDSQKADIRRGYEDGLGLEAIRMPGMSIEDVARIICEDEDYSLVDVMRDLQSGSRRSRFGY